MKAAGLEGEPSVRDTTVSNSWLLVTSSCIGTRIGSGTDLVSSPLWHHDDAPNLLHLRVVRRADSIQVACNLQEGGGGEGNKGWYMVHTNFMCGRSVFMVTSILIEPYMYTDSLASSTQTHNLPPS